MSASKSKLFKILAALVIVAAAVGVFAWYNFFRVVLPDWTDGEDYFKYGSSGSELNSGMPVWIWQVLPDAFPQHLPQDGATGTGWRELGFLYEDGKDRPIGIATMTIGFERTGVACALCHVSTYRETPESEHQVVVTGPAHQFDAQQYFRFLFACANDPNWNADHLLAEIAKKTDLSLKDKLLYRFALVKETRKGILALQKRLSWMADKTPTGPGRWIAFNDLKYHFCKIPVDDTIGNPDYPPMWNHKLRQQYGAFHWDGLNPDMWSIIQSAAIGAGASLESWPEDNMRKLEEYMLNKEVPKYPFPIDAELAAQGQVVYAEHCALCHEPGAERAGKVMPIDEIATDRHRFDMWTPETPVAYNKYLKDNFGLEPAVVKTEGYMSVFLDGIWLRGPYLHNGSVPTIADLLEPVENRPAVFYRAYDVYDQARVGFVADSPEAAAEGYRHDTALPANGNGGHLYGIDLPPESKTQLIEYLKTL